MVSETSCGIEGACQFHRQRPDPVILDEEFSDLTGWEVLARIRDMSDRPVLMLTTHDTDAEKLASLNAATGIRSSNRLIGLSLSRH